MNSFHQTAISFTSQNVGAKKWDRVKKIMIICVVSVAVTGFGMGMLGLLFGEKLLGFYATDAEVIMYGLKRLRIFCFSHFLCGVMDVFVGCIRGMGYSFMPMVVSLIGACGLRIVWIFTIFQWYRSLEVLYYSYPVTWTITIAAHIICFIYGFNKLKKIEK